MSIIMKRAESGCEMWVLTLLSEPVLTEIARRKPQGFDPGGEAGFSGVSTACAASEKNGAVEVMDGDRAQDVPGETAAHPRSGACA